MSAAADKSTKLSRLLYQGKPRSLSGLMGMYESNYQRLQRLIPESQPPYAKAVSRTHLDRALYLQVLERSRYTLTINLTYRFGFGPAPDLVIRLYHDAELAEVQSCGDYTRLGLFREFDFEWDSALGRQWEPNLLLNKWLEYLLEKGHGFVAANRPRCKVV